MNYNNSEDDQKPDLLTHQYRPTKIDNFKHHSAYACRLKQWIQDFIENSQTIRSGANISDIDDTNSGSDFNDVLEIPKRCVLLTGPPGVGKTTLVYTVAKELKLHVIESHSSEKRDSKLFGMLKLANQKGKINPVAKLFQAAQRQHEVRNRKRRKLSESTDDNKTPSLSLSGDTSVLLFDDIDVVFEEDGPFLKSLADFVKESKRPIILTATQSIDHIKSVIVTCEHIHLDKPPAESCAKVIREICKRERLTSLSKEDPCRTLADQFDSDIRQCLNRIHFYGEEAADISNIHNLKSPDITQFSLNNSNDNNNSLMNCYQTHSLIDIMKNKFNLVTKSDFREDWLRGRPNVRSDNYCFGVDLGEQITETIIELTNCLLNEKLMTQEVLRSNKLSFENAKRKFNQTSLQVNERIRSRLEPPEKDYFIDIVPLFSQIACLDWRKRLDCVTNGGSSRRSRRALSYLDSAQIYMEPSELQMLAETSLSWQTEFSATDLLDENKG